MFETKPTPNDEEVAVVKRAGWCRLNSDSGTRGRRKFGYLNQAYVSYALIVYPIGDIETAKTRR